MNWIRARCEPASGATERNNWDSRHQSIQDLLPLGEAI
jgi:hypothetical protein